MEQEFFIDVLKMVPLNSICYLQAPNLKSSVLLKQLKPTSMEYFKAIELDVLNTKMLIDCVMLENIQEDIQLIEIKFKDKLLFEGFDGVEYGTVSNKLELSDDFKRKYINDDICNISTEW